MELSFLAELYRFAVQRRDVITQAIWEHFYLSGVAVVLAGAVGVPVGILISRHRKIAGPVIAVTGLLYTIPSLALFGFLIPFLGIGELPALVALFIYGLLPVVRNTYVGITGVDPAVVEAATGMGVTDRQLLWLIELPLAMPVIVAGLRTMTVMTIGTATIAAMIGAGGLGVLIFRGISTVNNAMIIAGAVPVALLAVLVDWILGLVERRLMSRPAFRGQKESDRMRVKGQVHGV